MKEADCPPRHSPLIFHERPVFLRLLYTWSQLPRHILNLDIKTMIVRNCSLPFAQTVYLLCPFVKSLIAQKQGIVGKLF